MKTLVIIPSRLSATRLPGNLEADNLEGIIINVFISIFIYSNTINRGKIVQ